MAGALLEGTRQGPRQHSAALEVREAAQVVAAVMAQYLFGVGKEIIWAFKHLQN